MTLGQAKAQKILGWIFFLPVCTWLLCYLIYGLGYRVVDLKNIRRAYRELITDPRPLVICCNHLTYVDSAILIYAFGNHFWYWTHFRSLSWNLPAIEYSRQPFFRIIGLISKCIFIPRGRGPKKQGQILEIVRKLLEIGEPVTIFPEGRRSRTGRFDSEKLSLGIGKIISELKECRVLCVYLRSDKQTVSTKFPAKNSRFYLKHELITFNNMSSDKESQRAIVQSIADKIVGLEHEYFSQLKES